MSEFTAEEYKKALELAAAENLELQHNLNGYVYGTIDERVQHYLAEACQ